MRSSDRSSTRVGDYILLRRLSGSRQSEVYLGRHVRTGKIVAVKITPKASRNIRNTTTATTTTTTDNNELSESSGSWSGSLTGSGSLSCESDNNNNNNNDIKSHTNNKKEWKIHNTLSHHPNIIPFIEVVKTEDSICTVMKYAVGQDLAMHIHKWKHGLKVNTTLNSAGVVSASVEEEDDKANGLPLRECWRIFTQLVGAVKYMHDKGYVHRDIKPDNIFLDQKGNVLLGDFGLACPCQKGTPLHARCGTIGYSLPPCLWKDRPSYEGFTVDCWALGVCLYTMLHGRGPFDSPCPLKVIRRSKEGKYKWTRRVGAPTSPSCGATTSSSIDMEEEKEALERARHLVAMLLEVDPNKRATIEEVLLHPWVATPPSPSLLLKRSSSSTTTQHSTTQRNNHNNNHVRVMESFPKGHQSYLLSWTGQDRIGRFRSRLTPIAEHEPYRPPIRKKVSQRK